ncbi:MAG: aromatic ring-hydroxylating oxygenase subunit alpha [Pseudomonadales bacterium]
MRTTEQQQIIPLATINTVCAPIAEAKGMPNEAYTDPALFEFERNQVLGKTWAGIAFTSELPKHGFAKPVDFMGLPLAILRNRDGDFKVFHNVCSHRGMRLVQQEAEVASVVRCPYHSWTYDLNGWLKGTPHIGGVGVHSVAGFACEEHGLKSVRSAVWMGIIFVNLSGDAEDFDSHIEGSSQRWEAFTGKDGLEKVHAASTGSKMELEVNANWKLAVENYCEAYHLPWVHPGLNTYSPLDQHYTLVVNDNASGQGSYSYNLSAVAGISLPQFEDWPEDRIRQAEYVSLYPNVLLGIQADHVFALILQPLANDRTLEKLELYYVGDPALGDKYAACHSAVLESWRVVFAEDVSAVEGLQAGRKSPAFQGGVFTTVLDGPTHHFHAWVASRYANAAE